MPLTSTGSKVLAKMRARYGHKKGTSVFYASINKGRAGSTRWHRAQSSKHLSRIRRRMRRR